MNVKVLTPTGESGEITLDDAIFAAKVSVPLMHQIVTAQLAAARAGTHSTKTRGEVRGGGAKPWRQKGTGRARHGSSREPQWKGGGISFGPKPRDYEQNTPKKMKAAALRSALSVRARDGQLFVIDGLSFETPKTKDAIALLKTWGIEGKVLLVLTMDDRMVAYAFRNLPNIHVIAEHQLNVYDIMNADNVVFVRAAVEALQSRGKKSETPQNNATPPAAETPAAEAAAASEAATPEGGESS
jgi:large subunit ribosomal protein L4